ncbi:Mediator of RNA polymerase II transcription subunit 15a [Acorus gramineus]|uniref:Mediator of RNA polymerase II transcription subunit 15a n=1 Tax=Acorus gramineus TaxID=55184 RepID=A0AAV9B1Z4_ACOGR|nr:Mediator of RNA polymerase II transcription subunit 15a [Acorus gramineus]
MPMFKTLKSLMPINGPEGMIEIKKIAVRFEEKIYVAATSQKNPGGANPLPPNAGSGSQNLPDLGIPSANPEYSHMCNIELEGSGVRRIKLERDCFKLVADMIVMRL